MSHPQTQQAELNAFQRRRHERREVRLKRKRDQRTTSQETSKRARTAPPASHPSKQKATQHKISQLNRGPKKDKEASKRDEGPTGLGLDTSNSPDPPSSSSTTGSMRVHAGRTPEPTSSSPLYTLPYGSLHRGTTTLAIGLGADAGERKEHVRNICGVLKRMERRDVLKGTVLRPESFLAVRFGSVAERDLAGRMMGDSLLGRGPGGPCDAVEASDAAADGALGKLKEVSDVIQGLADEAAALRSMLLAYGMEPGKMKEVLELVMAGVQPDLAIFI